MNGYGSHTFKMVNADDEAVYVKFHYKSNQGIKCFNREEVLNVLSFLLVELHLPLISFSVSFSGSEYGKR